MRLISTSHLILIKKANEPFSPNVEPFFELLNHISVFFLLFFIVTYSYLFLLCTVCSIFFTVNTHFKFPYFSHFTFPHHLISHFPLICSRNTEFFSCIIYVLIDFPFHNVTHNYSTYISTLPLPLPLPMPAIHQYPLHTPVPPSARSLGLSLARLVILMDRDSWVSWLQIKASARPERQRSIQ